MAIVWDIFEIAAQAQARLQGVPDLPIFVIPKIAQGENDDDQRRKAKACVPELVTRWETLPTSLSAR